MSSPTDYILLVCDDVPNCEKAQQILEQLAPTMRYEILNDLKDLLDRVRKTTPRFILIYLSREESSYTAYLKNLRQELMIDNIPILIYFTLPEKEGIRSILRSYNALN